MSSTASPTLHPGAAAPSAVFPSVVTCDGHYISNMTNIRPSYFLQHSPRGVYTTARTVGGGNAAFLLESHFRRLVSSLNKLSRTIRPDSPQMTPEAEEEALRQKFLPSLRSSVELFYSTFPDQIGNDVGLTCLVPTNGSRRHKHSPKIAVSGPGSDYLAVSHLSDGMLAHSQPPQHHNELGLSDERGLLYTLVARLPQHPDVTVMEVREGYRKNAGAKDSLWVITRSSVSNAMGPGVNEVVMHHNGDMIEGLSSNFFAIKDGVIYTAPADGGDYSALAGTIRSLLLEVCREEGITVVEEYPKLCDINDEWEAAFITSTTRLLLPINEVRVMNPDDCSPRISIRRNDSYQHLLYDQWSRTKDQSDSRSRSRSRDRSRDSGLNRKVERDRAAEIETEAGSGAGSSSRRSTDSRESITETDAGVTRMMELEPSRLANNIVEPHIFDMDSDTHPVVLRLRELLTAKMASLSTPFVQ